MMGIKYTVKIIEPNRKQKKTYIVVDNGFWVITICFNRTFSTIFAIKPGIYMYIYKLIYSSSETTANMHDPLPSRAKWTPEWWLETMTYNYMYAIYNSI